MRSTKSIILIVIALGCGLIASIGISQVMNESYGRAVGPEMETIFVAAGDVPSWSKLNSTLVKQEEWPVDKVPEGAARSLEEFEGMSLRYPLYPGEPIVKSKLSDGTGKIASERIPEGHQVFAVKVDKESALAGLINPGDKVDVLVFLHGQSGTSFVSTGTRTIMRNVIIFAINDQIARSSDDESSIDAKTVSLLVRPEQSERLLLAKQLGTIHLVLRKPGDDSRIQTDGAQPGDLNGPDSGSDGQFASKFVTMPTSGRFDVLRNMKGEDSKAVDSSNAAEIPSSTMVIMSPEGIMGAYTFLSANKQGGLPDLPTELLGAFDHPNGGPETTYSDLSATDDVDGTMDDDGPTDDGEGTTFSITPF